MPAKRSKEGEGQTQLNIDNVVSSHWEIGPTIPDGGFGWIVLIGSLLFQILIPSLSVVFGIILLFAKDKTSNPTLWNSVLVYPSLFFIATWTFTESSLRTLSNSQWTRLIALCGVCLTSAGLLLLWVSVTYDDRTIHLIGSGILTGIGASLTVSHSDAIIIQYFRLKYDAVSTVLQVGRAAGFVLLPFAIERFTLEARLLETTAVYQLLGMIACLTFSKPQYVSENKEKYNIIQELAGGEEEDIFAKSTELQITRQYSDTQNASSATQSQQTEMNTDETEKQKWETFDEDSEGETITYAKTNKDVVETDVTNPKLSQNELTKKMEKVEDGWNTPATTSAKISLHKSFVDDFIRDLDQIERFEVPQPLFNTNTQVNNNTSYSYESADDGQPNVFVATTISNVTYCGVLKEPTFYKTLFSMITTKFSLFVFWTLLPSHVYVCINMDSGRIRYAIMAVGCIGIGGLLFPLVMGSLKATAKTRACILATFCWIGSLGYMILAETKSQQPLIFGATNIVTSLSVMQTLGPQLMKLNIRNTSTQTQFAVSVGSGLSFILFLLFDINYQNCFRLMANLHFIMGALWFSSFVFKKAIGMRDSGS